MHQVVRKAKFQNGRDVVGYDGWWWYVTREERPFSYIKGSAVIQSGTVSSQLHQSILMCSHVDNCKLYDSCIEDSDLVNIDAWHSVVKGIDLSIHGELRGALIESEKDLLMFTRGRFAYRRHDGKIMTFFGATRDLAAFEHYSLWHNKDNGKEIARIKEYFK